VHEVTVSLEQAARIPCAFATAVEAPWPQPQPAQPEQEQDADEESTVADMDAPSQPGVDDSSQLNYLDFLRFLDDPAEPVPVPAPVPVPVPVPDPVPVPVSAPPSSPPTRQLHILSHQELAQVGRIQQLFWVNIPRGLTVHIMSVPCEKPKWMTFERFNTRTKTSVTTINEPGTSVYMECIRALNNFMVKGVFKDAGLKDLGEFVQWIKDSSSVTYPRKVLKTAIGQYYSGRVYPLLLRFLFYYANQHGGNEGTEEERMARVNQAFKAIVSPPAA